MSLFKSVATFGGLTLVSRVTGFLRDMVLANFLGAGAMADAFVVAFKLPNLFRSLFAEGAFTSAFVPLFSQKLVAEGKKRSIFFAAQAMAVLTLIVGLFVILFELLMPYVVTVLAPGFHSDAGKTHDGSTIGTLAIHTEKNLNFQHELFNTARIIIFSTTILGFFGLACLILGIQFEFMSVKFIVYENRFTGLFVNPNQLGFITVVALLCCHLMIKKDFVTGSGCRRISRLWIAACLAINSISLLLSDSNGATILLIGYAFFFFIYKLFGTESSFSAKQIIVRSLSCLLAGMVIVSSVFLLRTVCQLGIAQMIRNNQSISTAVDINPDDKSQVVTFEHENPNLDSGRFTLWYQGGEMFIKRPVFGIGKGNIDYYGKEMFEDGVKFSKKYGDLAPFLVDFHNGYLTILVCSGITGFAFFCIFILKFFAKTTKHVLRDESLHQSAFPCLFSFISAYMIYSLIEVTLLFNLMFTVVFFWMILGYTSCFLTKNVPDHPIDHITLFGKKFRRTLF